MANMTIDGPVEISPELAMALYTSMPEVGRSGVAQMFASRLMSGPLSDKAVEAAARVYAERLKVGQAGAKALREGVMEKCRALGDKFTNEAAVREIVDDETRKSAAEFARQKVDLLMSAIPLEALIQAALPAIEGVVKSLAQQYFTRTQEGQNWILRLIDKAKNDGEDELCKAVRERMERSAFDGREKA